MLIRWWSSRSRDVFLGWFFKGGFFCWMEVWFFQGWILLLDGVVFSGVDFSIGWCGFFKVGFLLDEVYLFSRV